MKKRLLITSIVMMLVVAVALSTATYAWFTSSAQVTSSSISLTAATNSAASLGISWTDGNYGPSITAVGPATGTFQPACPQTLTVGTTTSEVDFFTALATPSGGDMKFKAGSVETTDVYTWSDGNGAGTHQSFFIKNLSPANSIAHITVTATITDTNNLVRVGIFKKDGENGYKLLGVLANKETYTYTVVATGTKLTAADGTYFKKYLGKYVPAYAGTQQEVTDGLKDYYVGEGAENTGATTAEAGKFFTRTDDDVEAQAVYGTITAGDSVNAMASVATTNADKLTSGGIDIVGNTPLAANGVIELVVLVWEDAIALGDAEHDTVSTVALSFDA